MKTIATAACAIACASGAVRANDLDLDPPLIYASNGTVEYNAATEQFVVLAEPTHVQFTNGGPLRPIMPTYASREQDFVIEIFVGPTGGLDGGSQGDDLLVVGEVDMDGDGENDFGQTLLKGEAIEFCFLDGPAGGPGEFETDTYTFRFYTNGGTMLDLFHGEVGVIVTSDESDFEDFMNDFSGLADAVLGSSAKLGACCFGDGSCDDQLSRPECVAAGGLFQGVGLTCDGGGEGDGGDVICEPFGACCYSSGLCMEDLTEPECEDSGGAYQGDMTFCSETDCRGACCFNDEEESGGVYCEDGLTENHCEDDGGIFQGIDVLCEDVNCQPPPPIGACCLRDGTCIPYLPEIVCHVLLGDYQGDGSHCEDVMCEPITGACCLEDQQGCVELTFLCCVVIGGEYEGDDTTCDEGACYEPEGLIAAERTSIGRGNESIFGACCLPEPAGDSGLSCLNMPEGCCEIVGGEFQGIGSRCVDVECGFQAPARREDVGLGSFRRTR